MHLTAGSFPPFFYYNNNCYSKKYVNRVLRCAGIRLGSGYGVNLGDSWLRCLHPTHRRTTAMSLRPQPIGSIPEQTARVAHAAFPQRPSLSDAAGSPGHDFPGRGLCCAVSGVGLLQGLPPWRLALVTLMQFRENLADRQAAEAVRARIDWKYLLGLDLTDPGFDFSVLSEFRDRLLAGSAEALLLDKLLEQCRTMGLAQSTGPATHRLDACTRGYPCHESPRTGSGSPSGPRSTNWRPSLPPGCKRWRPSRGMNATASGSRIRACREGQASRDAYAQMVGEDGFALLDALKAAETPEYLRELPLITTLRQTWQRHYDRTPGGGPAQSHAAAVQRPLQGQPASYPPPRRGSSPPMIRRRAIARNATRSGLAIWCMSVRHASLPCLTSSRTCTRPPLPSSVPTPSTRL